MVLFTNAVPTNGAQSGVDIPTPRAEAVTCSMLELLKLHVKICSSSLAVQLLGLLVEGRALLDGTEALDLQSRAGLLHGCEPWAGLGTLAHLLAHDFASLVLHKVSLLQAGLCLVDFAKERMALGEPCGDDFLLHSLHGLHGCHRLHCFHGFGHRNRREWDELMMEERSLRR